MQRHQILQIQQDALIGRTKEAWESLCVAVGVKPEDAKTDFWYNTASFKSSAPMLFVNEVLPQLILNKDSSEDVRNNVQVLMTCASLYNVTNSAENYIKVNNAKSMEQNVLPLLDEKTKYLAYIYMADQYKESKNLPERRKSLAKGLDVAPDMLSAYRIASDLNGNCSSHCQDQEQRIEVYKKVLEKPVAASSYPIESFANHIIGQAYVQMFCAGDKKDEYIAYAEKHLEQAYKKDTNNFGALDEMETLYSRTNNKEKLCQTYERMLDVCKPEKKAEIYLKLAISSQKAEKEKYAEKSLPYIKFIKDDIYKNETHLKVLEMLPEDKEAKKEVANNLITAYEDKFEKINDNDKKVDLCHDIMSVAKDYLPTQDAQIVQIKAVERVVPLLDGQKKFYLDGLLRNSIECKSWAESAKLKHPKLMAPNQR